MKEVFTADTKQDLDDNLNEFIENHDVIDWPFVTIVTEIVKDDTPAGYHWKATLTPKRADEAAKDLLIENGYVHLFWHEEDIFTTLKPMPYRLDEKQLFEVKRAMENADVSEYGMSHLTIKQLIEIFGENVEGKKFLLAYGDDNEVSQYEEFEGMDIDDFEEIYADSLEEAEEMLRIKVDEIRGYDANYYGTMNDEEQ